MHTAPTCLLRTATSGRPRPQPQAHRGERALVAVGTQTGPRREVVFQWLAPVGLVMFLLESQDVRHQQKELRINGETADRVQEGLQERSPQSLGGLLLSHR